MSLARLLIVAPLVASIIAPPLTADAAPKDDLVFAVQTANHDKHSGWVLDRLVTLQVGDKCWPKLLDKSQRGLALMASAARSIQRYASAVTGEDWARIEGQTANTPDANRATVDKLVDAFKPKFHLTLTLEGDTCSATGNDLWLKYLGSTLGSLVRFPPKSGEARIVLDVKAAAKDLTVTVDKPGTTFTITAPRDIERSGWSDKIDQAFQRASAKG
jgi:hypothetical protein